jgi:hypothetical protein
VFTDRRWTKEEPGYTPAASPRLRRRPSPWPPAPAVVTSSGVAHPCVRQARTAPSPDPPGSSWWDILGGFTHRFLAYSFSSCSPDPPPSDGAGHAPALSGPLATLPGTSRIGLPPASPACCDRPAVVVSHPHSNNQRLTAHVESAWGAVAGFPQLRFPRPLSEPDVRLSPHPALHRTHAAAAMTAQRCSLVCISRTRVCGAAAFAAASSGIAVPFCRSPAAAAG